eukprot:509153_1
MHKKGSIKHSKSKSNTLNFRIGHKLSKSNKNTIAKAANVTIPNQAHYTPSSSTHTTPQSHPPNKPKPFTLPPLTQTLITNHNGNHTSPSTSASTFYPKIRTDTNISISSEYHPPHSPSASYSFSENNSLTNPDFIVIEPQQYGPVHSHFMQQQHQKHFHPHYHNRPQSTPQLKTFKFDDNNVFMTNQSNSTTITPTQGDNINVSQLSTQLTLPEAMVPSPSQQSQQSQLSQTERFQQLMPDSSTTAMTPTPSPSAPNASWNIALAHSSPLRPTSNITVPCLDHLDLSNASASSFPPNKFRRYKHKNISTTNKMDGMEGDAEVLHQIHSDKLKNVTTMHPYRLYNEPPNNMNNAPYVAYDAMHLLDKPAQSTHSMYSIETEHSISRSFGIDEEDKVARSYPPPPPPSSYNPVKLTTSSTGIRDTIKKLKVNLTPTTSTPIRSPDRHNHHSYTNVSWQTYIGHFVFHEHDRGHSLYHSFKKIGEGVFARVYKTVRKDPQRTVALKVFPKKNPHAEGSFANELMLLHNVSHPNIVQLHDAHVDPKYFYLEMEVCRGGDIFKYLSCHGRIEERFTRQIIYKVVDAIRCFHERDFVHRDLKPENIVFVHKNDITDIRLIDFGETIHIDPQQDYNEFVGTPCYFAPERFRQHATGAELKKSDVWAIGVIMFEMLTGCRCFNGGDDQYEVQCNVMARKTEAWPPDLVLSSNAMDFWNKLLEVEPLKRYSCQQALRHDWLIEIFTRKQAVMNPFSNSPRLTPLQAAVQSPPQQALENSAIVIQTSQSMTNLKSMFKQQIDAHNARKKAQQRKYKDLLDDGHKHSEDDESKPDNNVSWKVRITRKKSRSLEHNELHTTLRKDDGSYQKLCIPPKHAQQQHKYRVKHRSNTSPSHMQSTVAQLQDRPSRDEESADTDELPSTVGCVLKHQKSMSSPAMSISVEQFSKEEETKEHEPSSSIDIDSTVSGTTVSYEQTHEKKHSTSFSLSYTEDNAKTMD